MKIVIFTFDEAPQERKDNVEVLAQALDADVFVGGTKTCENLLNLCKQYKNEDVLLLEDDIDLCNDFLNKVNSVIDENKSSIINFHYNRSIKRDEDDFVDDLSIYELNCSTYCYNQCVYLPKSYIKKIISKKYMFDKYSAYAKRNNHDMIMARIFGNDTFLAVKPSLVNHKGFESTIGNPENLTIDFIDKIQQLKLY